MNRNRQTGFSIVELMIAALISLLLGGALLSLYGQNKNSFNQNSSIARMQDDARFAMNELIRDIGMAGFFADLLVPDLVTPDNSLSLATDCGPVGQSEWMYRTVDPVSGDAISITTVDNATGVTANASHSCIDPAEIRPGTDIVAIKRVTGRTIAAPQPGRVYLRTNGTVGMLYQDPASSPPAVAVPVPFREWEFVPSIYYIQNFTNAPGDGIPALCRKLLQAGAIPTTVTECIAPGVEDLQVEYGLDTSGDGAPNVFLADPTLADLQQVVSAKIYLLARTTEVDIRYLNDKTYTLSNAPPYQPMDNFYRRIFTSTLTIRNLKNLSRLDL